MGQTTGIQWTDHTLNDWWGCVEVSPGCDHCYAKTLALRWGREVWGVHTPRYFTKKGFSQALTWQRAAEKEGVRRRVFVQSMSDIFEILPSNHPQRYDMDFRRRRFFHEIVPACPNLDFQLLTKRVGNVWRSVPIPWMRGAWPANVWLGISVVDQKEADRDIPKLIDLPAPIRFLSCEPLIEPVDLTYPCFNGADSFGSLPGLHWVIVGGESGAQARAMDPLWARTLRDQCGAAGIPFFFKQWGEFGPCLNGQLDQTPGVRRVWRFGKHNTGRLLDGREWNEFPGVPNAS